MATFMTIVLALITAQVIVGAAAFALMMSPKFWKWSTKKAMRAMEIAYEDVDFEKGEL